MGDLTKPIIVSEEAEAKFAAKIREIQLARVEEETEARARELGLPAIDLREFPVTQDALALVPETQARETGAFAFWKNGPDVRLATTDPESPGVQTLVQQLQTDFAARVTVYLTSPTSLEAGLARYARLPKLKEPSKGVAISGDDLAGFRDKIRTFRDLPEAVTRVSTTDLLALLLSSALEADASDIHIEARGLNALVRFRIDGVLHDATELERVAFSQLVSRVKLVAKLKINITAEPQDGSFVITLPDDTLDVRVATLPMEGGESLVLRLLRSSQAGLAFDDLGLRGRIHEDLNREMRRPNGMILTTGPTGSGKTTTLYAILQAIASPEKKIVTLEDPVEYHLPGVTQSSIDEDHGYTFARALRAVMRQDPDIIMVGEVRDLETADVAINAALTGHLVLSTLHSNSAAATIPRLLALGAKPFLLAPALNAVIGQRLVRRLCQVCKKPATLDETAMQRVRELLEAIPVKSDRKPDTRTLQFFAGSGCDKCQDVGYKGRIGVYELFTLDEALRKAVMSGTPSEDDIRSLAVIQGMVSMVQDGLLKALEGITSVDEVFRVTE